MLGNGASSFKGYNERNVIINKIKLALLSGLSRELIVDEAPIIKMNKEKAAKIGNLLDSGT